MRKNNINMDLGSFLTTVSLNLFTDGAAVLAEFLQNCQRAGARRVSLALVTSYTKGDIAVLEIRDDGRGLKKPQDLLKLASSGWDKAVMAADQPFGLGFWSCVTVASRVEVRSNKFEIVIDVEKLHGSKSIKDVVEVTEDCEPFAGFRVRLFSVPRDEGATDNRRWAAWRQLATAVDEISTAVRFMEFEEVLLRHHRVYDSPDVEAGRLHLEGCYSREPVRLPTREPLSVAPLDIPFAVRVDNEFYEGVVWPQTSSWNKAANAPVLGIGFYAQRRMVEEQDWGMTGGWVHLKPGAVNLRAPDRRGFVEDEKYRDMLLRYKEDERAMLLAMAVVATDEELEGFDNALRYVLKDEDVLSLIPYLFGTAAVPQKGTQIQSKGGVMGSILPRNVNPHVQWAEDADFSGAVGTESGAMPAPSAPRAKRELFQLPLPSVWVEAAEQTRHDELLVVAKDAGLPVTIAASAMQKRALLLLAAKEERLMHVSALGGKVTSEAEVRAPETDGGQHLFPALERLAHAVGAEAVSVGHLTHRKVLTVGDERVALPVREGTILLGMNVGPHIYVDASFALGVAKEAESRHDPARYIFFRLLSTVAHERAHQLTPAPDGTPEHLQMIENVLSSANDWIAENL